MYTLNPQQLELYHKLQAFCFDPPGATKTFVQRLALEQNWTAEYTERVLLEYRRFLLMSTCAGHPITPSHAVDEAWHLHLTYTVSYWHNLCRDTLGFELHHHPGTGLEQPSNFVQQYQRTLESYQRLFWETPPSDIWPDPNAVQPIPRVNMGVRTGNRMQGNRMQGNAAGGCLGFLGVLGVGVFMGLNLLATSAFMGFGVMVASFFAAVYVSNLLGGPAWASSSNNSSSGAGSCSSSDGSSFSDSGGDSGGNGGGDSGGSSDGGGSSCGSSCGGGCSS